MPNFVLYDPNISVRVNNVSINQSIKFIVSFKCAWMVLQTLQNPVSQKVTKNKITQISIAPYDRNFKGAGHVWTTCQGRYSVMRRPGVERAQHPNQSTTEPRLNTNHEAYNYEWTYQN